MKETLTIRPPNEISKVLNRTPDEMGRDLRVYGALMLFRLSKLSSGAASLMAGVPRVMFLDLCSEYDIPVSQITPEELRDLEIINVPFIFSLISAWPYLRPR